MKPEPRLCNVWRIWRGRIRSYPKNCAYTSSNGSRTVRRTTRSVLMFTTAGNTLPTAKTAGSEAGSACAKQDGDRARINAATIRTPATARDADLIVAPRFAWEEETAAVNTLLRFGSDRARLFFACSVAASHPAKPTLCRG